MKSLNVICFKRHPSRLLFASIKTAFQARRNLARVEADSLGGGGQRHLRSNPGENAAGNKLADAEGLAVERVIALALGRPLEGLARHA